MKQIEKSVKAIKEALRDGMNVTDRSGMFKITMTNGRNKKLVVLNMTSKTFSNRVWDKLKEEAIPSLNCFWGGIYAY